MITKAEELLAALRAEIDESYKDDAEFLLRYIDTLEDAYRTQACTLRGCQKANDLLLTANEEHYRRLQKEIDQLRAELKERSEPTQQEAVTDEATFLPCPHQSSNWNCTVPWSTRDCPPHTMQFPKLRPGRCTIFCAIGTEPIEQGDHE